MYKSKPYKVIVAGLPKTGTSTLAAMLRILGYKVTGPEIHFVKGDSVYLEERFTAYEAFQDYPWCFEWERFVADEQVKFIVLFRKFNQWWPSFLASYGNPEKKYLSYSYMGLDKKSENEYAFSGYYEAYYSKLEDLKQRFPDRVKFLDISTFGWAELCGFLEEPLPKNFYGQIVKKPQANKYYAGRKNTFGFKFKTYFRKLFLPLLGEAKWHRLMVFMRKSGFYICVLLLISLIHYLSNS